jgi:type IV pilus assembly protein PilB
MNMGLEPFLVVASLNTIVGQRLLRTICAKCKTDLPMSQEALVKAGYPAEMAAQLKMYKGRGCPTCNNTGYKGRIAIYEVLDFSPALKELVLAGASVMDLKKQAVKEGMKSLRMSGLTKAAEGKTTLEEALSLTMEN